MKRVLLLTSLLLTLNGCASKNTIKSKTQIVGKVKDIEITDLRSKRVNGVFMAQATLTNSDDEPHDVQYRCLFFDANQFDVSGDSPWNPTRIYGGEKQIVKCSSTSKEATDFKIQLSSTGASVEVYK